MNHEQKMAARLLVCSALALGIQGAIAAEPSGHAGAGKAEMGYQSAPAAIKATVTKDLIGGDGPPMTKAEFEKSKQIFFERCAPASPPCTRRMYSTAQAAR